jgi:ArsR family transcriptional regulator
VIQPDDFFAALADPTRRRILTLLQEGGERCVCVLYGTLDLPQPKVSRHLGVLRAAGVVATRREGLWVHYRIHPELPDWARIVLQGVGEATGPLGSRSSVGDVTCRPVPSGALSRQRRGQRRA